MNPLKALYSVVVGLALATAVQGLVDNATVESGSLISTRLPMYLCFLSIIVPFYQGAMRYMDVASEQRSGPSRPPSGLLLLHFFMLFIEASLLYYLSIALTAAPVFIHWVIILFVVDILWALAVRASSPALSTTPMRWAIINCVACLLLLALLRWGPGTVPLVLLGALAARTAADYKWNWGFYFPSDESS